MEFANHNLLSKIMATFLLVYNGFVGITFLVLGVWGLLENQAEFYRFIILLLSSLFVFLGAYMGYGLWCRKVWVARFLPLFFALQVVSFHIGEWGFEFNATVAYFIRYTIFGQEVAINIAALLLTVLAVIIKKKVIPKEEEILFEEWIYMNSRLVLR